MSDPFLLVRAFSAKGFQGYPFPGAMPQAAAVRAVGAEYKGFGKASWPIFEEVERG